MFDLCKGACNELRINEVQTYESICSTIISFLISMNNKINKRIRINPEKSRTKEDKKKISQRYRENKTHLDEKRLIWNCSN